MEANLLAELIAVQKAQLQTLLGMHKTLAEMATKQNARAGNATLAEVTTLIKQAGGHG